MKHVTRLVALAMAAGIPLACSDSTSPGDKAPCSDKTASVEATVTVGTSVVFNWAPDCPVAFLLVETESGSDRWAIRTPTADWDSPNLANRIAPPITYGVAPTGISDPDGPEPLVAGQTYKLVLWRILPSGSSVQCQQNFETACLLTVRTFTR